MASNYSLSTLTSYVDQNRFPLIRKSLFGSVTAKVANIQTGVKSAASLNILGDTMNFVNSAGCSFQPSGSTTVTQRNITVGAIGAHKEYCERDLDTYFTQLALKKGNNYKDFIFEEEIVTLLTDEISRLLEIEIWQGNTSSTSTNLWNFDGLIKLIDACSGSATVLPTGSTGTLSGSALITYLDSAYTTASADLGYVDDLYIFTGLDVFKNYTIALRQQNLYNYPADETAKFEVPLYGSSNIKIKGVPGLNGTNRIYLMRGSNIYVGTDLESDIEKFDVWYSQDNGTVRIRFDFKYGVQVAFCDQIVLGTVK